MRMIRGISTKWLLGVLASLALPLVGFAWYTRTEVTSKRADEVVRFHLLGTAADLADQLQAELYERYQDVQMLASIPTVNWYVADRNFIHEEQPEDTGPDNGDRDIFREAFLSVLGDQVALSGVYDRLLALDSKGEVVGWAQTTPDGPLSEEDELIIRSLYYGDESWFANCMENGSAVLDFHHSDFAPLEGPGSQVFHIGFAARIKPFGQGESPGAVVAFMDWRNIQRMVDRYDVRRLGAAANGEQRDIYGSSYAWIWAKDADTILAHQNKSLYGKKVSQLEGGQLLPLVLAAQAKPFGMYPDYEFGGVKKKAAFDHLDDTFGLQWVIGVGVNVDDIYGPLWEIDRSLLWASLLALAFAGALAFWTSRRMTRPVVQLKDQVDRVAAGDLDARVEVRGHDEVAQLARAFNTMAHDLAENRALLVKAEKESAWREMALQVAHEIKNPLTPIRLSVGLLRRVWQERRAEFEPVLHSTLDMIERQVDTMREVTRDFSDFAGTHKPAERVPAGPLLRQALELTRAWSEELHVRVHAEGTDCMDPIDVHPGELQRALVNLVNNALEAMPEGGDLYVSAQVQGPWVVYTIRDSGAGISEEAREHLFEPHFTTRSSGTGLGLAIVRRVVESRGGTVELVDAKPGPGAMAIVRLPLAMPSDAA